MQLPHATFRRILLWTPCCHSPLLVSLTYHGPRPYETYIA
jgi:hypothetical protein